MITTIRGAAPQKGTAIALGFFDGVHLGHLAVMGRAVAAARADGLIPAVFTFTTHGATPAGKRGYTHLATERERYELLERAGAQLIVCPDFHEIQGLTPREFAENILAGQLKAKAVCCGEDFRFGKNAAAGADELRAYCEPLGVAVHLVGEVLYGGEPISSTRIRRQICQGGMEEAAAMLGRAYSFSAPVIQGKHLGRRLGFPTINQPLPPGMTLPLAGVYATRVQVGEEVFTGVTNIGPQPTVGGKTPLAETYILDYQGDLYGRELRLEICHRLREVRKFASVEELTATVRENARQARALLEV